MSKSKDQKRWTVYDRSIEPYDLGLSFDTFREARDYALNSLDQFASVGIACEKGYEIREEKTVLILRSSMGSDTEGVQIYAQG